MPMAAGPALPRREYASVRVDRLPPGGKDAEGDREAQAGSLVHRPGGVKGGRRRGQGALPGCGARYRRRSSPRWPPAAGLEPMAQRGRGAAPRRVLRQSGEAAKQMKPGGRLNGGLPATNSARHDRPLSQNQNRSITALDQFVDLAAWKYLLQNRLRPHP